MIDAAAVEAAITDAHRSDWAGMLAATARVARDLDLAEECVQEAYASAMKSWVVAGIPDKPAAWLTTAAKRRAIDAILFTGLVSPCLHLVAGDVTFFEEFEPATQWQVRQALLRGAEHAPSLVL